MYVSDVSHMIAASQMSQTSLQLCSHFSLKAYFGLVRWYPFK